MSLDRDGKVPPKTGAPEIYILSVPGGGMRGILPAMALDFLEQITETPVTDLFQVSDTASTGSILAAMLNVRDPDNPDKPKYSAADVARLYCVHGPDIFPEKKHRVAKMITADVLNVVEDFIDPLRSDFKYLVELQKKITALRQSATPEQEKLIDELEKTALARWITKNQKSRVIDICDQLTHDAANPLPEAGDISELIFLRRHSKNLSRIFRKSAIALVEKGKDWAKDYRYDSGVPAKLLRDFMGDVRMEDSRSSLYIWAYDVKKSRAHGFIARKGDYFDNSPDSSGQTSGGNIKIWDAVMGSIVNAFAFANHTTENGIRCEDLAIVHTPLWCVHDTLKHRPRGTKVKLVSVGTGTYLSKRNESEILRPDQDIGTVENIIRGDMGNMLKNYAISQAHSILHKELGCDNIFEFSPRLSPRTILEEDQVPSRNELSASEEDIQKLIKTGQRFIEEQETRLRELAGKLIDNLYNADRIDPATYMRIKEKIQNFTPEPFSYSRQAATPEPAPQPVPEPSSGGNVVTRLFNRLLHRPAAPEQDNRPSAPPEKYGTGDGPSPR